VFSALEPFDRPADLAFDSMDKLFMAYHSRSKGSNRKSDAAVAIGVQAEQRGLWTRTATESVSSFAPMKC